MQHANKNKTVNGFTIIELIMVMIIIGVLAAVAIPRFQDIVVESEVAVEQRLSTPFIMDWRHMHVRSMSAMAFAHGLTILLTHSRSSHLTMMMIFLFFLR